MEENHYYPFGLKHDVYATPKQKYELVDNMENTARPTYVLKTDYQYKYNGKEYQDELGLNLYDYGFRNYDPALGRWLSPDPLSEEYSSWSPYNYVKNNPVFFIDPNGLWVDDYQLHDDGSVTLLQKTDDKSDTLYASNADGSVDKSRSVTVDKEKANDSSVIGDLANNVTSSSDSDFSKGIRSASTTSESDAFNLYSFVAKNSNVEWGMDAFKSGSGFSFTLYTGHSRNFAPSTVEMAGDNLKNLIFSMHSHKERNSPSFHGTIQGDFDADLAKNRAYLRAIGKNNLDYHEYPPAYMLYAPDKGGMNLWRYKAIPGGETGFQTDLGTVTSGSLGNKIMNK